MIILNDQEELFMEEQNKIYFMGSLRAVIILLVIVTHASLMYVIPHFPNFVHDPHPDNSFWIIALTLQSCVLMPAMFFAAGFFLPKSLKKGPAGFIKGKLIRLGIPFIAGSVILAPSIALISFYSDGGKPGNIAAYLSGFFQYGKYTQIHFWFLGVLMAFFIIAAMIHLATGKKAPVQEDKPSKPSFILLTGLFITTAFLSFVINLFVEDYRWTSLYVIEFQTTKIPVYIVYFLLGIYAYRKGWFKAGFIPNIYLWTPIFIITSFAGIIMVNPAYSTIFGKLIYNSVISLQIMSFVFTLISLSRKTMDKDTPFLREISRSSYTVYIVHLDILFIIAYLTRDLPVPLFIKFLLQVVSTAAISWVTASVLIRIPGFKSILDESGITRRKVIA